MDSITKQAIVAIRNRMSASSIEMNDQPSTKRMFYELARGILEMDVQLDPDKEGTCLHGLREEIEVVLEDFRSRLAALEQMSVAVPGAPMRPVQWEYMTLRDLHMANDEALNTVVGSGGWELVLFIPGSANIHGRLIFKRPKATE